MFTDSQAIVIVKACDALLIKYFPFGPRISRPESGD
jgi:hypothetical protein